MALILIVEDNDMNLDMLSRRLKRKGYDIVAARDGKDGVDQARSSKPDLILMDIQLPGMDGLTATRIIKTDPVIKHIPVVAFTSFAMDGDEEKAIVVGCTGYITKPVDTKNFLKTLESFLK